MEVKNLNVVNTRLNTVFKNCSIQVYSDTPTQNNVRNVQKSEVTKIKNSRQMEVDKQNKVSTIFEKTIFKNTVFNNCSINVYTSEPTQHHARNVQKGEVTKNKSNRQIKLIDQNKITNELPKHRVRNVHRGKVAKNKNSRRCYRSTEPERRMPAIPALPPLPKEEEAKEEQREQPIVDTVAQILGFVNVATVFYKSNPRTMMQ
uniref:Uncharacterized protein n=1 Tax=Schizaphis graminum TaxID=13262 RepID=A0A2S2NJM3_SCHGA